MAASEYHFERQFLQNPGFCRNCLSKWYSEAAKDEGLEIDYETSREKVYGMSYENWKNKFQKEASQDQMNKFNKM